MTPVATAWLRGTFALVRALLQAARDAEETVEFPYLASDQQRCKQDERPRYRICHRVMGATARDSTYRRLSICHAYQGRLGQTEACARTPAQFLLTGLSPHFQAHSLTSRS